ncbi:hypothetical protein HUJ04_011126 [Dendroctonus ponderosae]|nr:hypothetical protein HUJ04_011126 [Dendroctonus ponderosae]
MWVSTLKYNPELWTTTAEAKSRIRRRSLETTEDQTKRRDNGAKRDMVSSTHQRKTARKSNSSGQERGSSTPEDCNSATECAGSDDTGTNRFRTVYAFNQTTSEDASHSCLRNVKKEFYRTTA